MNRLTVNTENKQYDIIFYNSFDFLLKEINNLNSTISKIGIISDSNVHPLYCNQIKEILEEQFDNVVDFKFQAGEQNKNLDTINHFYDFLIQNKFDRNSMLIALGGGVTGDMVGFTASTFMRGIKFIQVPTSLLAQVDSSIGGKTGVDYNGYKNLVGAFYQPELVYINTSTLQTLPLREFNSGMAEVIKHGFILDSTYLMEIINNCTKIKKLDHLAMTSIIKRSCNIKRDIVSEDEKEQGIRAILNYGHTLGHAIERLKEFKLLHGECIAIGFMAAAFISLELGHLSDTDIDMIENTLKLYDLPRSVSGLEPEQLYAEMFLDKKTSSNALSFILLDKIGNCYVNDSLDKEIIINAIKKVIIK